MTKSGNKSWHSVIDKYGNSSAYDIVPADGDFNKLKKAIYTNPEIVAYMMDNNLGILEETTDAVKRKTGAKLGPVRGNHFHVGPDRWARSMRDNAIKLYGMPSHPIQDVTWEDVQARKQQTELTPEEEALLKRSPVYTYDLDYEYDPNKSRLAKAVELDHSLDEENPARNWALLASLFNDEQNKSDDPLGWMSMMASLAPKPTVKEKRVTPTYQLFAP